MRPLEFQDMSIEDRIIDFFIKQSGSKNLMKITGEMGVGAIWTTMSHTGHGFMQSDSLIEELHKFGHSEITHGVNIRDYIHEPEEHLAAHLYWQEQRFKKLTLGSPTLESLAIPRSFNISGKHIDEDSVIPITAYRLGYYVHNMLNALDTTKRNVVLEIGGGFGLTSLIFKRNMRNSCYIIIDIETTSVLSAYFLMSMGLKVCLYGEFDELNEELMNEYDVIILPPHYIEKFSEDSIDLAINTASFSEMSPKYIDYYLTHINRIADKLYCDTIIGHPQHQSVYGPCSRILKNFEPVIERSETPINYLQPFQPHSSLFGRRLTYDEQL